MARREIHTTLEAAVSDGLAALQELRDECREVYDGAQGTPRENTGRVQILGETADTLDCADDDPAIPDAVKELTIDFVERVKRKQSRSDRCSSATALLDHAVGAANLWLETNQEHESKDDVEQLVTDLEEIRDNCDGVEFPGW